ncbi:2'-5' RNA ligase family protein [Dactylosporangium maewongense]|uniref:2'-5' RNA ligase family protein n=1 Tax=Dactylosporangium maewongense TaxID=634393 RepID=UPI0031CF7623
MTTYIRAQFGLVSSGAFPPHITLVGSQHLPVTPDAIVEAVTCALAGRSGFDVHNNGPRPTGSIGMAYDVHHLADGTTPNQDVLALAAAVHAAVDPLTGPAPNPAPHTFDPDTFRAHLSLVSHDLYARPDLRAEVFEFIQGLPVPYPERFHADAVALYRTRSDDWTGRWWTTLTWEHMHTWRL